MKELLFRPKRWSAPILAVTFGALMLPALVLHAQTLPPCVYGNSNGTPCTVGNAIALVSDPTGVFDGRSIAESSAEGGLINDPLHPGFFTGNIIESVGSGSLSRSGSIKFATLSGLPTIVELDVFITCGVTGRATASLSVDTGNGSPGVLGCPTFTTRSGTSKAYGNFSFVPVSSVTANLTLSGTVPSASDSITWTNISVQLTLMPTYFFPHLAFGGGYQTTLTYLNYSTTYVSCTTTFLSDSGGALTVPFADGTASSRTDNLEPGASLHVQTKAATGTSGSGWAEAQCTRSIKASLLYRYYSNGVPQGEAGVNAMSAPAREFATFAETRTGVAWANPSNQPAVVTISAFDATTGRSPGNTTFNLPAMAHGAKLPGNP